MYMQHVRTSANRSLLSTIWVLVAQWLQHHRISELRVRFLSGAQKYYSDFALKGKLSWAVNLKKTAWTLQVWFKAASIQGKTARIWRAFGGERDNSRQIRAESVNEKWPENLACYHKRIYLNACAAHDSFPLKSLSSKYFLLNSNQVESHSWHISQW